ncbi:right-handed parallel beta-helix repeat-containing protein [Nocardioides guangzhouensis]|uniref:Right-handed parallel beta-helix repeat-containing protein n=1 Tax=Nocardioides guangzhouensis TaxID=2497878 RepID=A0A4Q4ZCY4_9ACTN|nr:right-handed parallel beta-helix repeat-containing protein [Nocardioides guangzhouensis]
MAVALGVALTSLAAVGLASGRLSGPGPLPGSSIVDDPPADPASDPGASVPGPAAPRTPPAEVCGSRTLDGPGRPPTGAIRITTDQNLMTAAENHPEGTTFWLTSGRHVLGPGEFTQVVPKDRQRFIGAPGAVLDGQRQNSYAFGGPAQHVRISHLTVQSFGTTIRDNSSEAVVNHDGGAGWVVQHTTIRWNAGAGLFLGSDSVTTGNCLEANGQYGFTTGSADGVLLRRNEITGNNTADWERLEDGCGCTGGGKFWETTRVRVVDNWVHHNRGAGLFVDTNNAGFRVEGNLVEDNTESGLIYETSYNAVVRGNTFARNALVSGPTDPGFPRSAIYISESGSDTRVGAPYGDRLLIEHNRFIDNWGGVVGWENADRFAGSPVNTSTGYSTLVNPRVATVEACADPDLIGTEPYVDDCRWKTQHLRVRANVFQFDPSHFEGGCRAEQGCGFNGLFANWGTTPDWSPYMEDVVMKAITFDQDNVWADNRYTGPWRFMVEDQGNVVGWEAWRGAPYHQDAGSTRD